MKKASVGFTLIELMIVVAIIGILAAIAIPKFSMLIAKSQEGNAKGSLSAIRSALSIYYGDNEGFFPTNDLSTMPPKYIEIIPPIMLPVTGNNTGHPGTNDTVLAGVVPTGVNDMSGGQGWLYDNNAGTINWGRVIINCSHNDNNGTPWSSI